MTTNRTWVVNCGKLDIILGSRNVVRLLRVIGASMPFALYGAAVAQAQDWISLDGAQCKINADGSVINDTGCGDFGAACEKDIAVGDLDKDFDDDLIVVRKGAFFIEFQNAFFQVPNLLFLNEDGVMTDRTDMVGGFQDPTIDRDVVFVDVDDDAEKLLDVVTAATFGEQPRVYMNLGCCSVACSPTAPCDPQNKVPCVPGVNWCGLQHDPGRLPTFVPGPNFCSVSYGDVNGDQCPDLFFVNYDSSLHDRLLINTKQAGACTGQYVDETTTRICPDPAAPACFNFSDFGTTGQILDLNDDFCDDIIKAQNGSVKAVFNSKVAGLCTGDFSAATVQTLASGDPYAMTAGDVNNDFKPDVYVVRDTMDGYRINEGGGVFAAEATVQSSPKVDGIGGTVHMADMDGDFFKDVLVSDVDVELFGCFREQAILRTVVDPADPMNVTISDPLGAVSRQWNTQGTYDTGVLDVNGD